MLALHPVNGRLYHVVSDAHDVGPIWLARPIVPNQLAPGVDLFAVTP